MDSAVVRWGPLLTRALAACWLYETGEAIGSERGNAPGYSAWGSEAASDTFGRIVWASSAGVEPRAYPGEAARRALRSRGAVPLAWDLKQPELLLTKGARRWEDGEGL